MRIEVVPLNGSYIGALVVSISEMDEAPLCENCGKRKVLNHPRLVKEIQDWCLECNDERTREGWTDERYLKWSQEQTMNGNAVIIMVRG